jgi:hypothetical protein
MREMRFVEADDIMPSEIEHRCEEIFDGEMLEQKYNYLVYHFDLNGSYYWARSYTDEIHTVSVYGPFDGRDSMKLRSSPLDEAVFSYLKRRFARIQVLRADEGYVTLWSCDAAAN